ncbi:MAG: hypothetical protein CMD32_07785 [Flavobacteriales bacterium]|jgi:hypothetical protein|nr:hypothetical protein [Flavobacteriales bacterium]|tara:strand:+ start:772 stop:1446 length:675 start_codon:yes stop_codon:yes gene_type:complete
MEFNGDFVRPFGPTILEADCPDFIVEGINEYTDKILADPHLRNEHSSFNEVKRNLLGRDLECVFLDRDFCEDIGLIDYLNYCKDEYIEELDGLEMCHAWKDKNIEIRPEGNTESSKFLDVWVNIYEENDFTPVHDHGGDLSGIIILDIPEQDYSEIPEGQDLPIFGKLSFLYGENSGTQKYDYFPEQEIGMTFLFPTSLPHLCYPHRVKGKQRRTLSFNFQLCD